MSPRHRDHGLGQRRNPSDPLEADIAEAGCFEQEGEGAHGPDLPSTAMRLRWLSQYLIPNAGYLRGQYNIRHPLKLPWFYGARILRGISKLLCQGHLWMVTVSAGRK